MVGKEKFCKSCLFIFFVLCIPNFKGSTLMSTEHCRHSSTVNINHVACKPQPPNLHITSTKPETFNSAKAQDTNFYQCGADGRGHGPPVPRQENPPLRLTRHYTWHTADRAATRQTRANSQRVLATELKL